VFGDPGVGDGGGNPVTCDPGEGDPGDLGVE